MSAFMTDFARNITPKAMKNARISADAFIEAYNDGTAEFIDVRVPTETAVWQMNFGLKIPANELPERLEDLPKDKLLVIACPYAERSSMAYTYLSSQGFHARYLEGGLLGLVDRLKGGGAKDIHL